MPTTIQVLKRLSRQASRWGGEAIEVSEDRWSRIFLDGYDEAPFTNWDIGIHYANKSIVYTQHEMPTEAAALAVPLIHEMGHVFAERELESSSNEFDFFGWEQTLALKLGFSLEEWLTANKDYYVTPTRDIGSFQTKRKDGFTKPLYKIIEDRMRVAEALGLVKDNQPQSIRS